jgi:hypothetical protein
MMLLHSGMPCMYKAQCIAWDAPCFLVNNTTKQSPLSCVQDLRKPGSQAEKGSFVGLETAFNPVGNGYPGGPFDPLRLSK